MNNTFGATKQVSFTGKGGANGIQGRQANQSRCLYRKGNIGTNQVHTGKAATAVRGGGQQSDKAGVYRGGLGTKQLGAGEEAGMS